MPPRGNRIPKKRKNDMIEQDDSSFQIAEPEDSPQLNASGRNPRNKKPKNQNTDEHTWNTEDPMELLMQLSSYYQTNENDLKDLQSVLVQLKEAKEANQLIQELNSAKALLATLRAKANLGPKKEPKFHYKPAMSFPVDIEYTNIRKEINVLKNEIEYLKQKDASLSKRIAVMCQKGSTLNQTRLKKQTELDRSKVSFKSPRRAIARQSLIPKLKKKEPTNFVDFDPDDECFWNPEKRAKKRLRLINGDWCTVNIENPKFDINLSQDPSILYEVPRFIVKSNFEAELRRSLEVL